MRTNPEKTIAFKADDVYIYLFSNQPYGASNE